MENQGEEYSQDHNKHWMKMFEVHDELVDEFHKIVEKIKEKEAEFDTISKSNGSLKQKSFNSVLNKLKSLGEGTQTQTLLSAFIELFNYLGMKLEHGCNTGAVVSHAMFTAKDTYDSQVTHTDYPYKMPMKKGQFYAWTAVIPLTEAGSWLHLWYGTGKGKNVHIKYGSGFLFRSDVVHAG